MLAGAGLDVEIYAVEHGGSEGARGRRWGRAAEEVGPQVVGQLLGIVGGREGVGPSTTSDGEENFDALPLACMDVGAQAGTAAGRCIAVPGKVEGRGLAVSEGGEEC